MSMSRRADGTLTRPWGELSYALQTLIDELTMKPIVIRDGQPAEPNRSRRGDGRVRGPDR